VTGPSPSTAASAASPATAPSAGPVAPGPTASDIAAAAQQSPAERQQMIEGMVSGLAARLDADPSDTTGWERLFRAYMVLGKPDEARAALSRARASLAEKPELLAVVEQAARDIGIGKD